MVAFVTSTPPWGEKTNSKSCTFYEGQYCHDNDVPIIPVKLYKGGPWPPKTPEKAGTCQNRMIFTPHLVYIDGFLKGKRKSPETLAIEIKAASDAFKKKLVRANKWIPDDNPE